MKHVLEHIFGLDGEQVYNLLSGLIPVLLGLGFWGQWWHKHNCQVTGCWRLSWHPHPDHGHIVCRKHHPNGKGVPADDEQ